MRSHPGRRLLRTLLATAVLLAAHVVAMEREAEARGKGQPASKSRGPANGKSEGATSRSVRRPPTVSPPARETDMGARARGAARLKRSEAAPPRAARSGGAPSSGMPGDETVPAAAAQDSAGVTQGSAASSGTTTAAPSKTAKTNVYTFGAMDVEGKLKTPQLLYFLNRLKLELEMSAPDRRSFMKELEKTAEDPNL